MKNSQTKILTFILLVLHLASCSSTKISQSHLEPLRELANQYSCSESFIKFYQSTNEQNINRRGGSNPKLKTLEIHTFLDQYSKDRETVIEALDVISKKYPDFSSQQLKTHFKLLERYCGL